MTKLFIKLPGIFTNFLVVCLIATSATSCSKLDEESTKRDVTPRPLMRFEDKTVLESYKDSILQWRLRTDYLERWSGSERIFVKPIDVDIFDSTGAKVAFLRADSGSLDTKMTFINAYGHVHAHSPDGASVRADSLTWNKADDRVQTMSEVRVLSPEGDVLAGIGFISDSKLEEWKILKNVRGIFQEATICLEENESP
jgi:LPS export ABC transporter protein LptC